MAERRCHVRSHVAPNACHHCCCHRPLRIVAVIATTPTIAELALPPPGKTTSASSPHFFYYYCCIAATVAALLVPTTPHVPLVWLVVTSSLVTPTPPVHRRLHLLSRCRLLSCPSHPSHPAGCCVTSCHANASVALATTSVRAMAVASEEVRATAMTKMTTRGDRC